jgi:acetate kinase
MERTGMDAEELQKVINKQSGVYGVSGISNDMRDIEAGIEAGNERAKLAMDMYEYHIIKYIGSYTAALNGVDVIVFTGGVGENQTGTREKICRQLSYLGVTFNAEANKVRGEEIEISGKDSKVRVVVIPTDEEMMIAQDTAEIVSKL